MLDPLFWATRRSAWGRCLALVVFAAVFLQTPARVAAATAVAELYTSPVPGAKYIFPQTTILIRSTGEFDPSSVWTPGLFTVTGSVSGVHAGNVVLSDDARAVIFKPVIAFTPGETVHVSLAPRLRILSGAAAAATGFDFEVTKNGVANRPAMSREILEEMGAVKPGQPFPEAWLRRDPVTAGAGAGVAVRASATGLDTVPATFPHMTVSTPGVAGPGRLFLANFKFTPTGYTPYLIILNRDGSPYWYRQMPASCFDFKPQPNGELTYWDGVGGQYYALDSNFAKVDSFQTGNGYYSDLHELRVLDNGHALLMSYDTQTLDMSTLVAGGDTAALVTGLIIQELDTDKNVVFQWRSWDHFNILDAHGISFTAHIIDCVHGNALDLDNDGRILLSSRHIEEITKIDRGTGAMIWRLGGSNNQFTFVNDSVRFSYQHAVRRIANGDLTLFDNGDLYPTPFSRAVEYKLDEVNKVATQVWEFRHDPQAYSVAMGYVQRLDGGNSVIGWGATNPSITEVDANGTVVFELNMDPGMYSYRAVREVWPPSEAAGVAPGTPALGTRIERISPSPLRGSGEIVFTLARAGAVKLSLYDAAGREVRRVLNGTVLAPGEHRVALDGARLASGVYYGRLFAAGHSATRGVVVVR